ncbi:eukaryotic translation initiation factor X-chromosomal [Brachionus plicatilis]|uniref:Eukaryotic translation initiation factor X-chromosomal n=1 Tax=Brachionus plicatilis TaxID=10195 RepID=A0A3M7PJ14_BRAPC|nr:eukaryotic translation initiation factor X-chromosomal [Brachionus plicatilis]
MIRADPGQSYGVVFQKLGNGCLRAICSDGDIRICHIRGNLRDIHFRLSDFILISIRNFQDKVADIIARYSREEAIFLINDGEIPKYLKIPFFELISKQSFKRELNYTREFFLKSKPSFSRVDPFKNSAKISETQMNLCWRKTAEEKKQRSKNVIIFGIDESERIGVEDRYCDDRKKIERIFNDLKIELNKIEKIIRFNKKPNSLHKSPILVELKSEQDRNYFLYFANRLKYLPNYSGVFIRRDLPIAERETRSKYQMKETSYKEK